MRTLLLALAVFALPAAAQTTAPTASGTLSGTVTDVETGEPIMGAGVVIPALGIGAVSQRDGTYTIADVPPGEHSVRTGAFRYHLVSLDVADGADTLDITLRPGAAVGCEVLHSHEEGTHPDWDDKP